MHFKSTHNFLPMFYINLKKNPKVYCWFNFIIFSYRDYSVWKEYSFWSTFTVLIGNLHIQFIQISENWFVFKLYYIKTCQSYIFFCLLYLPWGKMWQSNLFLGRRFSDINCTYQNSLLFIKKKKKKAFRSLTNQQKVW